MAQYHTVVQGEHLSSIAKKYGFHSYKTIWDDGQNADLKKKRQNPNVLLPGDQLFIPDKAQKTESRNTGQTHRFQLKTEGLKLRLVVEDLYERPIAHATCELQVDGEVFPLTTDDEGRIERSIKPTDESIFLTIKDPQTPINEVPLVIKIGHLDPVEEISGQKARLNNLGYVAGPVEGKSEDEKMAMFQSAVEEFQCDHALKVDGKLGPISQAKLKQAHGC